MKPILLARVARKLIDSAMLRRFFPMVPKPTSAFHSSNRVMAFSASRTLGHQSEAPRCILEILDSPPGSLEASDMDNAAWKKVHESVRNCHRYDDGGVLSFQMMDRIAKEIQHENSATERLAWSASFDLYALLKTAVYQWRNKYVESENKSSLIQPSELVSKVRKWSEQSAVQTDTPIYTMILEAASSNAQDPEEGVLFAESLLEWMVGEARTNTGTALQPTTLSVAIVMKAWVSSSRPEACDRIETWLDHLTALHEDGWPNVKPNVVLYNTYLHALAEAGRVDRAEHVLQSLLQGDYNIDPDPISFTTVLSAYSKVGTLHAMALAETLLSQMLELSESGMESAKPNVVSFTTVMNGYAQLGEIEAAEKLLHRLEEMYHQTLDPDWDVDVTAYNTMMTACSRAGQPKRAGEWLQRIIDKNMVHPNNRSFHTVLTGWAKMGQPDQAEALLNLMHDGFASGGAETRPTVVTYNIVINAWARSRRKDAWKRARDIVHHMEDLFESGDPGVKPNALTWNTMFKCYKFCGQGEFHHAFKAVDAFLIASKEDRADGGPNLRTWNTLLGCCVMNTTDDFRVREVWRLMKEHGSVPDIISYNTTLSCYSWYAKHGTISLENVEALLSAMRNDMSLSPSRATYIALLDVWIAFGRVDKAEKTMSDLCTRARVSPSAVQPDRDLFHRVIRAWSMLKHPRRVESIVLLMEELHMRHYFEKVKPNVETYNQLINAWANSQERQAGERADLILREMATRGIATDSVSYDSAVNAWANSGDCIAPTKIEHLVLEMIMSGKSHLVPTELTYTTWLKAIEKSNEKDRMRRVKELQKTMKIHHFEPKESILVRLQSLAAAK